MVKRIFKYLGIATLLLLTAMLVNTLLQNKPEFDKTTVNTKDLLKDGFTRYAESIRFRVIGHDDAVTNIEQNKSELQRFHDWMRRSYPILAKTAKWETINGGSLLITIKGQNNGPAAMFLGHLDVVPADDSALEYENLEQYEKAINTLKTGIERSPENETLLYEIAFCFEMAGLPAVCAIYFQQFIDEHPYSFAAWQNWFNAESCDY